LTANLIISFTDQSPSFTYGVEFGRLLEKMERGDTVITNNGFPVRIENKQVIIDACTSLGYIPSFGNVSFDEWVEFIGIKKVSNDC